mmetsp:Transcript_33904/g.80578  ORF Transcript_33904/g.80578 Transcript_33904/m.80578 type:complete len:179 (-) Transcript_33904:49-585(-)
MPFWPVRASAYSVVEEERGVVKKHRMTIDLSWPRPEAGLGVESVNGAIDRSAWPVVRMVRAAQLAESAAIPTRDPAVLAWLRERPEVEGASSLGFFGLYVDDGAGGSIDDLSEPTKEQSPREVLEVLGVEIDLVGRRLRLTPAAVRCMLLSAGAAVAALHVPRRQGELSSEGREGGGE